MKRTILFAAIFLLLLFSACNKNDEQKIPDQFPAWLTEKVNELITNQNLCEITTVTYIEYKGKMYYHVYCGIWSCMYCQLFDAQGNRPEWETNEWNDFLANKKEIKTVPACQ